MAISTSMNTPMTIRAQTDYMCRVVGATITQAPQMVRLKVRRTIGSQEGCRCLASLAFSISPRQYVVPDIPAPLIDVARSLR